MSRSETTERQQRRLRRLSSALAVARQRYDRHQRRLTHRWQSRDEPWPAVTAIPPKNDVALRLMTLNVAHGRRTRSHQALLRRRTMKAHVAGIAGALAEISPDVAALQEADGPSTWSGNFDHVATLAWLADLGDYFRGDHNPFRFGRFKLASGTALLAQQPLLDPASYRFASTWRDTKGFVVATVQVPEFDHLAVDVVSVHLDFLNPVIRRKQIHQMVEVLSERPNPLVVLGDLNCCFDREPRSLGLLTEQLGLRAYEPDSSVPTYPLHRPRRRLDWILVSSELAFTGYHTVEAPLSDHRGVVADLALQ